MAQLNLQRREIQRDGMMNILRRNEITTADVQLNGYMIQESTRVGKDGSETTKYQLFKLMDQEIVTLSININKNIVTGISQKGKTDGIHRTAEVKTTQPAI